MRERVICEQCGQWIVVAAQRAHEQGTRHRQTLTIRTMLADPRTKNSDVADKLGISRERVRQIAHEMRLPSGRERQAKRRKRKMGKAVHEYFKKLPVYSLPGFVVEPVYSPNSRTQQIMVQSVMVNGHRCAIRSALRPPSMIAKLGKNWIRINPPHGPATKAEFILFRLPRGIPAAQGWLVVPAGEVPNYPANLNLGEERADHHPNYHGRWRQFVNRWGLLLPARRVPIPTAKTTK
jgi:hypothetical protein